MLRFGALPIGEEPAAEFMGYGNTGDGTVPVAQPLASGQGQGSAPADAGAPWVQLGAVPQRDADLLPLWHAARAAPQSQDRAAAAHELEAEVGLRLPARGAVVRGGLRPHAASAEAASLGPASLRSLQCACSCLFSPPQRRARCPAPARRLQVSRRASLDAGVVDAVHRLLASPASGALRLLHAKYGASAQLGPLLAAGLAPLAGSPPDALVAAVVERALPRPSGAPLVDSWDCLRVRSMLRRGRALCQAGPARRWATRRCKRWAWRRAAGCRPVCRLPDWLTRRPRCLS